MLGKVKKRSGVMKDFDKAKLKASLKKAGAKEEHVIKVVGAVSPRVREGMTTAEIKRLTVTELRRLDPKAAQTYETFKKPMK